MTELQEVPQEKDRIETEKDNRQKEDRIETENRQNTDNQQSALSPPDNKIYMNWCEVVDRGAELPNDRDRIKWKGFIKAWRGWYRQAVNPDIVEATRAKNMARYEYGKSHIENNGYEVNEIIHTGSINLVKRDSNLYTTSGQEMSDSEIEKAGYGFTTGWTEYTLETA